MIPCCPVTTNDGYWQASALIRPLVTVTRYMLVIPDTQNKAYFDTYCTYEHVFMHVKWEFTTPLLELEITTPELYPDQLIDQEWKMFTTVAPFTPEQA